jgi:erythronate-4-phosphate dehydrogenase
MKIVADDKIPFLKGILEPYADIIYLPGKDITKDIVKDADALLIRTRTRCTRDFLEGTSLKFIGTATIGFDHIDTQFCGRNNIFWTNAPGCNSSSVQQYIIAALLKTAQEFGFSLKDKILGISGVGNVGSKVEKFGRLMGMRVLLNDPPRARREGKKDFVKLSDLLRLSDIVTLHVPLNFVGRDSTYHMFDEKRLTKMKKGALLLNTSRGEVIETDALKKAVRAGWLKAVVLDVWENEPDIDNELLSDVSIATPHIAGYSTDGKANGTSKIINSLCEFFKFPLTNWYPPDVPVPDLPFRTIECQGKTDEDIIREAVFHSYDINLDDRNLRSDPNMFEKLRGDYRIRREFPAYSIELVSGTDNACRILKSLGFKIL